MNNLNNAIMLYANSGKKQDKIKHLKQRLIQTRDNKVKRHIAIRIDQIKKDVYHI